MTAQKMGRELSTRDVTFKPMSRGRYKVVGHVNANGRSVIVKKGGIRGAYNRFSSAKSPDRSIKSAYAPLKATTIYVFPGDRFTCRNSGCWRVSIAPRTGEQIRCNACGTLHINKW